MIAAGPDQAAVIAAGADPTIVTELPELEDHDFAPWDGRRVPVTLLGGYLGAGKTTVLNEVLGRTTRPIAVLVNDVGSVNVDASLVARRHGDTIELTDGCVCCSLNNGLAEAFDQLRLRAEPPDHVIVELSGVADPRRVVPWAKSPGFKIDSVTVLVDADQFLDREADPDVGPAVRGQLVAADVLVLNKLDLVTPEQADAVRRRLAEIVPDVPVWSTHDAMATAGLIGTGTRQPGGAEHVAQPELFDVHRVETVPLPRPVTMQQINDLLDGFGPRLLRAKGVAIDPDGTPLLIQVVGRRRDITELPQAEAQLPTDLVVITPA